MRRALVLLLLAACGEPLVGPEYVGTPDFSLGGVVVQGNTRIPASHGPLALGVFWIRAEDGVVLEQETRLQEGLAEYGLTLFDAPPAAATGFSDLLPGGALALGVIALYADRDDDGALDLDVDLLLGASAQHVLVYAGARVEPEMPAEALLGVIEPGYHVFEHDRPSGCPFVSASACAPEGALVRATSVDAVSLTLWPTAEEVIVPAPALVRGEAPGSIWSVVP